VRTAIDRDTLRSRADELFAYNMVVPDGNSWQTRVDISQVDEPYRQTVYNELTALLEFGLFGLGKTKATAKTNILDLNRIKSAKTSVSVSSGLTATGVMIVTLQTRALLCSPEHLDETSDNIKLKQAYQATWSELCPGMTLVRYFARQTLSGGKYQYQRFRDSIETPYYPWLLTEPGSVFVFTVQDKEMVEKKVEQWCRYGLELSESICRFYKIPRDTQKQWQHCPFIPQNGYGEIVVNLKDHQALNPMKSVR
jgi:hypothetical protein